MTSPLDQALVRTVLDGARRAPSAHNAQPWRLTPLERDAWRLWYAVADKLRADPDDRDGLIAVGAFLESIRLNAHASGLDATFEPDVRHHDAGIDLGIVRLVELAGPPDPLAESIALRQCNRSRYEVGPPPVGLVHGLEELGNMMLPPHPVDLLVRRASILSWRDRRFVSDLTDWTRFDTVSPDGMTLDCLRVSRVDELWLHLALRLGRLPAWLAWFYAERDVRLTRASAAIAVLTVADRSPESLLDVGRRLIRSWTLINALGYAWHPMSVVIDQSTVAELTDQIGGLDPVAIYRVGRPTATAAWSNRRSLDAIVVPRPDVVSPISRRSG